MAILALRYQWLPFKVSFGLLALSLLISTIFALISLGFALLAADKIKSLVAMGIYFLLPIAVIAIVGSGWKKPIIHDVSTQPGMVEFVNANKIRGTEANPLQAPSAQQISMQQSAYPKVKPLKVPGKPPELVYEQALSVARSMGWNIVYEDKPQRFEAVARTQLLRFADDIAVVISAEGQGATVNVRSVSRVGKGDLGANAARIERFLEQVEQAAKN